MIFCPKCLNLFRSLCSGNVTREMSEIFLRKYNKSLSYYSFKVSPILQVIFREQFFVSVSDDEGNVKSGGAEV